jgi:hypothetical protein
MAFPYAGDAKMRAKMAGELKGIVAPTDPLTPLSTCSIDQITPSINLRFRSRSELATRVMPKYSPAFSDLA